MTRREALIELAKGNKITHRDWGERSWMKLFINEHGVFGAEYDEGKVNTIALPDEDGYELYKEPLLTVEYLKSIYKPCEIRLVHEITGKEYSLIGFDSDDHAVCDEHAIGGYCHMNDGTLKDYELKQDK